MQGSQGTPPTPPPGSDFGNSLGQFIGNAVNTALSSTQVAMQQELDATIAARDSTQHQLDLATTSRERSTLTHQLAAENKKIADLRTGLEKIKNGQD